MHRGHDPFFEPHTERQSELEIPAPDGAAKMVTAYLLVVAGSDIGRMFKLDAREMMLGRDADMDIVIDDDGISRCHARVVIGADRSVTVWDLGSTNGTYFEGERVTTKRLAEGEKIRFGKRVALKLCYNDSLDEAMQRRLYESATRDALTGAYNKRYFFDSLGREFAHCRRADSTFGVILFDIDHFKQVNDTHGHLAGDYVLTTLASVVGSSIRSEDVFARFGGEEFAILVRGTRARTMPPQPDAEGHWSVPPTSAIGVAQVVADKVRKLVEDHEFVFESKTMEIRVSVGAVVLRDEHTTPNMMLSDVDRCLYEAKGRGRNCVVCDF